jgi:hypothetical protein
MEKSTLTDTKKGETGLEQRQEHDDDDDDEDHHHHHHHHQEHQGDCSERISPGRSNCQFCILL